MQTKCKSQINTEKKIQSPVILQVEGLTKYYKHEDENNLINIINLLTRKEDLGVKDVDCDIYQGQIIGIIGQKKCGKSTLLKMLAGVIKPSSGKILYKGVKVNDALLREIASYISSEKPCSMEYSCNLFENIIQYACRDSRNRVEAVNQAEQLITDFGLEEYKYKEVIKLPNAARNKMFIIRGLLSHKSILCFDKPFDYIEAEHRETFIRYLKALSATGKAIILTSYKQNDIKNICNHIICI